MSETEIKTPKSFLKLVEHNDNVPYADTQSDTLSGAYSFYVEDEDTCLGLIIRNTVQTLKNAGDSCKHLKIDDSARRITLAGKTWKERSKNMSGLLKNLCGPIITFDETEQAWVRDKSVKDDKIAKFHVLNGWRSEDYPIHGPNGKFLFKMERAATPLFGVVTYGSHLTAFSRFGENPQDILMWVGKRSMTKQTYPGKLDNSVGGGIKLGHTPLDCIAAESKEEAGLDPETVFKNAKAAGVVSYYHERTSDAGKGDETHLLQPEVQYVYDLEVGTDQVLKNEDGEVGEFLTLSVDSTIHSLRNGDFKPNCASIILDFLIRHSIITQETEPDYEEIVARLHRRHRFPTRRCSPEGLPEELQPLPESRWWRHGR